ncbi:MAG: hypothetical protein U1A05_02225, partial [Alphaproteobacteria bacterium]|nr:hypothetical protein [Alphaproteobacteria bacterium]
MKYYFIAFSLILNTSVIAMDDDQEASHFPTGKQDASNSFSDSYSSDEESDGKPVFLFPISFMDLTPMIREPIYANDERPTREY